MLLTQVLRKALGDKKKWRQYKSRAKQLPRGYRTAVAAFERYAMYFGGGGDDTSMYVDLVELFEQGAATQTPIRQIVGENPLEFIELFVSNYPKGHWIASERERLIREIARATEEESTGVQ
jgi:DNA-binding ferritin-like protein (Dps family)